MTPTLIAFMDGLIDYAGLFPPARLGMKQATETFLRHLDGDFEWILGCFICPVSRLGEFSEHRSVLEKHAPIQVSVLGTPQDEGDDFLKQAVRDAESVTKFEDEGWARCSQFEVKWPHGLMTADAIRSYSDRLTDSGCVFEHLFFEIRRTESWHADVIKMATELARAGEGFGFKIRTGGLTADLYPSPKEIAQAMHACRDAGVPFKATAGLHHPIRHTQPGEKLIQHGFVNVFGAAAFAHGAALQVDDLELVIDDRELTDFAFGIDGFTWRQYSVGIQAVRDARSKLGFSYGSCNFDEPLEDLASAGLL
jgi:hypothetical protein